MNLNSTFFQFDRIYNKQTKIHANDNNKYFSNYLEPQFKFI